MKTMKIGSFFLLLCCSTAFAREHRFQLTETEKEWIKAHPVIRVANEMDWPPFDFNEFGKAKGLAIDHLELLAGKTGLTLEYVHGHTWGELIELFGRGKIDVMPVFYINEARKAYTLYTTPYYRGKLAVFTNTDSNVWRVDLLGKRVGMETGHGSIPLVKRKIPGIEITEVDRKVELVRRLATGQLDAIIGNPFVFYHIAKENQLKNILLSDFVNMSEAEQRDTSLHIGVRKDWPVLHGILQKAMDAVTHEEMADIRKKWADIEIVRKLNWGLVAQISGMVALGLMLLIWHNRRLKRTVALKTGELKNLNEQLELKVEKRTSELLEVNERLSQSLEEVKTLRGIIPICSYCKKIRDDQGAWEVIEAYIGKHSDARFSHGACPDCYDKQMKEMKNEGPKEFSDR